MTAMVSAGALSASSTCNSRARRYLFTTGRAKSQTLDAFDEGDCAIREIVSNVTDQDVNSGAGGNALPGFQWRRSSRPIVRDCERTRRQLLSIRPFKYVIICFHYAQAVGGDSPSMRATNPAKPMQGGMKERQYHEGRRESPLCRRLATSVSGYQKRLTQCNGLLLAHHSAIRLVASAAYQHNTTYAIPDREEIRTGNRWET